MPFGNRKKYLTPAMPFGNRKKNILQDLFTSELSPLKKYNPPEKLKFNYLGIFQSLKWRILKGKFLSTILNLNFTLNTLGCYGLILFIFVLLNFLFI